MHIATKSSKLDITSESTTAKLAKKFSKVFKRGDVVFLHGEIGSGKTTFIRYLINSFQKNKKLKQTEVTSPTFNLVNEYEIENLKIQHYDLFRLKNKKEIANIGLLENFSEVLTLVEWPEKIIKKPKNRINLKFKFTKNFKKRFLVVENLNKKI